MAQLNTGNLGGGITHTFEFDYNDLQTDGFLGTSGALTGSSVNPSQTFGANNQKIIGRVPIGGKVLNFGIVTVEATAGASDLEFYCDLQAENVASLSNITDTTANLVTNTEFDNRTAGYSLANNGNAYTQNLDVFLTGSDTGLDGLTGGTDAENGAAAALALYNNRGRKVIERTPFGTYNPANVIAQTIYFQINGTVANLTAGKWLIYMQIMDPISLINGKKPDALA
jgi:hypothetical protein